MSRISDSTNRGRFLVYENNAVRLNNEVFPATNISVGLNASIDGLMDIDGSFVSYAPNGPLQGNVEISFDLTGALPVYMQATGISELPTLISFNNIVVYGYLQDLNFSVSPYQPVTVNSSFAFYHGIRHVETYSEDPFSVGFNNTLKTYNGAVCRLANKKGGSKLNYSLITDLDYSLKVKELHILK